MLEISCRGSNLKRQLTALIYASDLLSFEQPFENTDSRTFVYVYRDDLTSNLPVLEYRHSSDDEVLSVDDMDSTGTYETADEMDDNDGGNLESSGV